MSEQDNHEKPSNTEDVDKQMLIKLTKYYQSTQPKLVEFTKQIALKDKIIAALKNNLSELQKERDTTLAELDELKNDAKSTTRRFEGQTPQKVLERIVSGNKTWCLVEYPNTQILDEIDDDDDDESNIIWMSQEELIERVNELGITLNLPSMGLSSTEASTLRSKASKLEETLSSLEVEYKKYRVDMEMTLWNKNTQIENLQNTVADNSSGITTEMNAQLQVDYESLKMQKDGLLTRVQELEATMKTLESDKELLIQEKSDANRRLEIVANESEDWKRKYKTEVKKTRDDILLKEGEDLEEETRINSLKKEIEILKKRLMVPRKSTVPVSFPTKEDPLTGSYITAENYEYLRNIMMKYFSSKDKESKERMTTAILTVLRFTPQEIEDVKKSSQSNRWWNI